jgi:hypothetical protein
MNNALRRVVLLLASLAIALGPWIAALPSWGSALEPVTVAVGLPIIGGVVVAWLGESPLKIKQ